MPGLNPNNQNNFNPQFKIDFDAQERISNERQEVISKYNIGYSLVDKLTKKEDGRWYINNETVEDWDASMRALDEKGPDDYKYGRW